MKKITVITRVHSNEKYIENAITSILNQTLSDDLYEILIIDDNSNKQIKSIIHKYGDRMRIIETNGIGVNKTAIIGFKETKTEYGILMDSDDFYIPSLLEEMLDIIEKEGTDFVVGDYIELEKNENIKYMSVGDNILNAGANAILYKAEVIRDLGYYDLNLIFPEYKLLFQLIDNYKYSYIPKVMSIYRRHHGSVTGNRDRLTNGMNQLRVLYGKRANMIRKY